MRKKKEPTPPEGLQRIYNLPITELEAGPLKELIQEKLTKIEEAILLIEPGFKEAEARYLEVKNEYDKANQLLEVYKQSLNNLSNLRRGFPQSHQAKIISVTTHNEHKKRGDSRGLDWQQRAFEYLQRKRLFITYDHLFSAMMRLHNPENLKRYGYYRSDIIIQVKKVAANNRERGGVPHGRSKPFIEYNGMIGLVEFCTNDLRPKPEFLREVMAHNDTKTA